MRKSVFALAVIAASSSMAFAAEVTKDKAHVPAVKATTMSDADMDKVTAGFSANQVSDPTRGFEKNAPPLVGGDGHSNGHVSSGGCNRLGTC